MDRCIIRFEEIRKEDVPAAGGKGANLGELTAAGIPVPPGAVLTTAAYDRFMEENRIDIPSILEAASSDEEASVRIRGAILAGKIPAAIREELTAFYRTLGRACRVAVRSSATAEDLEDSSFAGQQETYLNVIGEDAIFEKIPACYASLWGNRAISYRKARGYDRQRIALAVVIQQMIESDCAGVLFTADPAGDPSKVLINASYGLGEAVVSGIVSPDEYTCDRDGNIVHSVIGSKECRIIYAAQGTMREDVPEELRKKQVLNTDTIRQLTAEAMKIEAHYGQPMDIEWAIKDGEIFILQARNITTSAFSGASQFSDEDFAGLPAAKPATGRMRENVLFNLEKLPVPYFPLDHDFGDAVGKQKQNLIAEAGIRMNEMTPIDENGISSFAIGGMRPTKDIFRLPKLLKQMKDEDFNIRTSTECLEQCVAVYQQELERDCSTIREIGLSMENLRTLISGTAYARFRYAIFPQVLENMSLDKTLHKVDPDLNSFDLMEGLSYVTADINREMDQIAREIKADPQLQEAALTRTYAELTDQYPALGERFKAFMKLYGNRTDFNCYCFTSRSWNEDPDRFLNTLRTMLRSADTRTPDLKESQQKFEALMERVRDRIGERSCARFAKKTEAVRHYHMIREATQYLWESIFALCRLRLRAASILLGRSYEDLLYLFADEFFKVCQNGSVDDTAAGLIDKRKAKRPLAEAYWSRSIGIMLETGSAEISGVCGSAGKATGRACVIKGPEEFGKLQEGEILVCTYTDPEWTPLFTLAAGVVVDTGGTLSHAAIVAREYRIPAVLAAGSATARIKDGDLIMVDGNSGKVSILEKADSH